MANFLKLPKLHERKGNESEIFQFLAEKVAREASPNSDIATPATTPSSCLGCHHTNTIEQKPTRDSLCMRNKQQADSKAIIIKTNDTDVIVMAVRILHTLQKLGLKQLWVSFGQGQNLRWIPVHELCCTTAEKRKGISFFRAFSVCDVASELHCKVEYSSLLGKSGTFAMKPSKSSANSSSTCRKRKMKTLGPEVRPPANLPKKNRKQILR